MSDTTKIQWATHTGGPYLGCYPVSPGCVNCYAWALAESRLELIFRRAYQAAGFKDWKTRPVWGREATRVLSKGFWKDAVSVNRHHAKAGTRGRWFPSMIDWLEDMPGGIIDQDGKKLDPVAVLADFLKLIHDTPNLDWLLLTKRPENWYGRLFQAENEVNDGAVTDWLETWLADGVAPHNVWLGVSVEDQPRADERIPELLKIPAAVRFLSLEPLLGPVDLSRWTTPPRAIDREFLKSFWGILGGESGPGARPCNVEWIRDLLRQCQAAGVPCFVKQVGTRPYYGDPERGAQEGSRFGKWIELRHPKGGDLTEWPEDLRIRQFPRPSTLIDPRPSP